MSDISSARFNLIDEPWITARYRDGTTRDVSIRTAFHDAGVIRDLSGELPTQSFAILRLLLAVVSRTLRNSAGSDPRALWENGIPVDAIDAYLDAWHDRFWLLHPEKPVFQVADLANAKGEMKDTAVLIFDLPSNNRLFTTRTGAESLALPFAEAARWLVNAQAFDPSGIKSGDPRDPRVKGGRGYPIGLAWAGHLGGITLEGDCLERTLLLNLVLPGDDVAGLNLDSDRDLPVWELDTLDTPLDREQRPRGPVQLFVWQSRRIRLVAEGDRITGCLVCNGDALTPQNQYAHETMTAWRFSDPQTKRAGKTTYMPREHRSERAFWRGISALLPQRRRQDKQGRDISLPPATIAALKNRREDGVIPPNERIGVRATGVIYGSNNSVVADVLDDRLTLASALFEESNSQLAGAAEEAVHLAEEGVRALRHLAHNLAVAAGGDGDGPANTSEATAYDVFDRHYRDWVEQLDGTTDPVQALAQWRRTARDQLLRLGAELVATAGPAAWGGREITTRTGSMLVTTPLAESWFRRALRTIFGDTTEETSHTEEKTA